MTREEALALMQQHTPSESLRKHMLSVESAMRFFAERGSEDVEKWGIAGLLHDFDYEQHPDEHPLWGLDLLREKGVDEEILDAIAAHYPGKTGVEPERPMARALFAVDELSGLITACVYVRPSKSVLDLEVSSVMKKFKTANFAAGVNRDDVRRGAELLSMELGEVVGLVIQALQRDADRLDLRGSL